MRRKNKEPSDVQEIVANAKKLTRERGFRIGLVTGALITVAIAIFIIQNAERTDLEYLWLDFSMPLWIGLLAAFAAGSLAGPLFLSTWRRHRRAKQERRAAEHAIKEAEKNLS